MVFLWGGGSKSKNPDEAIVPYFCNRCGNLQNFAVLEHYKYGHVYGIRIAKWNTTRWLECLECSFSYSIQDVYSFNSAKEISAKWKPILGTEPELGRIFQLCGDVAQTVLKDSETAKKFYELAGVGNVRQSQPEEVATELSEKYCENCEESRPDEDTFCSSCGNTLVFAAPVPNFEPGFSKYCEACEEPRPDEEVFCPNCGKELAELG